MSNKTYNAQTRIKKFLTGIIAILFLFYLVSCGSDGGSSPSGKVVVNLDSIKALTLKEVSENSITLSWSLLRTEEGVVDNTLAYAVYAETHVGGGVFTKDPSTETVYTLPSREGTPLPLDDTGYRADGVEVTDLNNNTPYRIVVEARDALGNTSQSRLLAYTASELTNTDITNVVVTTTLDQEEVTVTWDANTEAQGYAIQATVSENQFGGDTTTEDIIAVVCLPESLLCEGDGLATEEGGKLKYNLKVHQKGVRYGLVIVPFNFRDLTGLQAVDEGGLEKTFIEEVLARIEDETSLLATRLESTLEDPGKVQDVKVEVSVAGPPTDLSLTTTGSTVLATWGHGEGADFYYAFITSNAGVNAVTNIIDRHEPGGRFAGGGYTSFSDLTTNTSYTVTVQSFTVITNSTNVGGEVSATLSTKDAEETLDAPVKITAGDLALTNHEAGKLGITWKTPESNSVIGYNVFYWVGDAPGKPKYVAVKGETNLDFTLDPDTYNVRVDVLSTYPGQEVVTGDTGSIVVYDKPSTPRDLGVVFSRGSFTEIGNKLYATSYPLTYTEADTSAQAGGPLSDVSYHYRYRVAGEEWNSYQMIADEAVISLLVDDLSDADKIKAGYGKKYQVELAASNDGGFVSDSEILEFTYKSFPEPFIQSENLEVITGDRSLTVTWPDVAEKNGSAVAGYTVVLSDDPYGSPLQVTNTLGKKVVFEGLVNNHSYLITVIPNGRVTGNLLTALSLTTGYTLGDPIGQGSDEERILATYTGVPVPYTPQGAPGAVENLAVTPADDLVTITWSAPDAGSPATRYVVEYLKGVTTITNIDGGGDAELSGLSWQGAVSTNISTNLSGSYSHEVSGLNVSSATNVFRVRAVRIDDSGKEWVSEYRYYALRATLSRPPSSVGELSFSRHVIEYGVVYFMVNWSKPTNAGVDENGKDAVLDGYRVTWWKDAQGDGGEHEISDPDTLSYLIAGLTPGTQYHVKVEAKNDNTTNAYNTGSIGDTYTIKPPGVVTNIVFSDHTPNRFKVTWDEAEAGYGPEGKLPSSSMRYELSLSSDQGATWREITRSDYSATEETFTGLIPGTQYRVRIRNFQQYFYLSTVTLEGSKAEGETWTPTLPEVVGDLTVSDPSYDGTDDTAGFKVTWTAPTDTGTSTNGDPAVIGYQVVYTEVDDALNHPSVTNVVADTEHVFTGLKPNAKYEILVRAQAVVVTGPEKSIFGWTPSLPGAVDPESIAFTEATASTIRITWTASEPGRAGGPTSDDAETWYHVGIAPQGQTDYTVVRSKYSGTALIVSSLSRSTEYRARITATNDWGDASPSISTKTGTTTAVTPTPPSPVRDLTVVSNTHDQVMLSWIAPTDAGTTDGTTPATLSSYVVKYKTADSDLTEIGESGDGVQLAAALTGASTNATVIGLQGNTGYTFLVVAVNSGNGRGEVGDAPTVEKTTGVAPPGGLRNTQTCAKTTEVDLTWDPPSGATSYEVYRGGNKVASVTTTSYTDTGLTAGTSYTYTVRACKGDCSSDSSSLTIDTLDPKSFKAIIDAKSIPTDLTSYDERSREIFSRYDGNTPLVAKYLKPGGSGDGSSFDNALEDPKAAIEGITDASDNKVYVVLLAGGTYTPETMAMKNHVAIVGGVGECLEPSDTVTALDGKGERQLFNNDGNGLNNTALLYGVTIADGKAREGGGMFNFNSSPSLEGVTFSGNTADRHGGGIYNFNSSLSLEGVTFSGNTANEQGGGMHNTSSSPRLERVTFSGNTAMWGGGIYNSFSSSSLEGVTFSGNSATEWGGGIYNSSSSLSLVGVTFSGNSATEWGGGMFNDSSSPSLERVTFSGNTADQQGGGMYNKRSSPSLVGVTFSGNTADQQGGGMYNDNNGKAGPLIINTIFWGNTAPSGSQFHFFNDPDVFSQGNSQENLRIYNSIVEGGTGTLISGTTNTSVNQGGFVSDGGTKFVVISFSNISAADPKLLPLADNGGSVLTHAIPSDSPAVNKGLYVRKSGTTFYYSADDTVWYTGPDLSLSGLPVSPPADAVDVTDATGHTPTDQPDLGAYEYR